MMDFPQSCSVYYDNYGRLKSNIFNVLYKPRKFGFVIPSFYDTVYNSEVTQYGLC